jgi:thiopurine S-methyltransferase
VVGKSQAVQPQISEEGAFKVYRHAQISLYCGDFFAMTAEQLGRCDLFYDRAALIALPEPMRQRYVTHLGSLLQARGHGLLVTLDYLQTLMPGPPFAVSEGEVNGFGAAGWQIELLERRNILDQRFRQRGLDWLEECAYRLELC